MSSSLPRFLPRIYCDFHARGWSGAEDDDCFYVLHREQLAALPPREGLRVLLWMDSDEQNILAIEGLLEHHELNSTYAGWRARSVHGTEYEGPPDEAMQL